MLRQNLFTDQRNIVMNKKHRSGILFAIMAVTLAAGCIFTAPPQDMGQANALSECVYERPSLIGTWRKVGSNNWAWGHGYEPVPENEQTSRISFESDGTFRRLDGYEEAMAVPFRLVRREHSLTHETTCLIEVGAPGNAMIWDFSFGAGDTLTLGTVAADAGSSVYVREY